MLMKFGLDERSKPNFFSIHTTWNSTGRRVWGSRRVAVDSGKREEKEGVNI